MIFLGIYGVKRQSGWLLSNLRLMQSDIPARQKYRETAMAAK